ncbi:MAG: dCTP deaminase [Candidatus Binataceae bacterium]
MILSDAEILRALEDEVIAIEPRPTQERYNASAVDLTLGTELFRLREPAELVAEEPAGVEHSIEIDLSTLRIRDFLNKYARLVPLEPGGYWVLKPKQFALGVTHERIELPRKCKIAARVEGRSTLARLGLVIHMTAPTVHCGFEGHIILEMHNFGPYPLRVRPGFEICQLILERLGREPRAGLTTAFMHQSSVVAKPSH